MNELWTAADTGYWELMLVLWFTVIVVGLASKRNKEG